MRLTHKLPCHTEMVLGEKEWASLKPEEETAQKEKKTTLQHGNQFSIE